MFRPRRGNWLRNRRERLKLAFPDRVVAYSGRIVRAARLRSRMPHPDDASPASPGPARPVSLLTPLVLLAVSLGVIALVWSWLARPVALARAPIDPSAKLDCISYAPFRGEENPLTPGLVVGRDKIAADMAQLAGISNCVRTYSIGNGIEQLPEIAAEAGLKVMLGIWIGTSPRDNALQIENAVELANRHPETVSAVIVGNEVLLRNEMTATDLARIIRGVKARVKVPVTYADVWEFWLRNRELADAVDFVTIHILPYWEDLPTAARLAATHVGSIRSRAAVAFPGKEILIGETGWPSQGRMREGALPSRTNQARVISEVLALAKREGFRVNLIEAYDQPWKRQFEGTVGNGWGLMDGGDRALKYPIGTAVSDYPHWKMQMGVGMGLSALVFAAGFSAFRRRPESAGAAVWLAIALSATAAGVLVGIAAEKMAYESYRIGDWLRWGALLAAAIAAQLVGANALMAGRRLPTFVELIGPRTERNGSVPTIMLGAALLVTTLAGTETALGLVFDPRYRDFPFAALTMAAIPFAALAVLNRPRTGPRPMAEAVFGSLFVMAALYIGFHEGLENWQAIWTCAGYGLLGITLWQARAPINKPV